MPSSSKRIIKSLCPKPLVKYAFAIKEFSKAVWFRTDMMLNPQKMAMFCPCCGMKFRSFGAGTYLDRPEKFAISRYNQTRQDVLCPICRALPRHRILALWCEDHKKYLINSDILYFAPEKSMSLWMKRNKVSCVTADLFKNVDVKLDMEETGLPIASYDVVIANHVLEHVDDFRKALNEMYRILKPSGMFICSFPMDPKVELLDEEEEPLSVEERIKRFGQYDHKRVFGMKAEQFLIEAGFEVEVIKGENYPAEILPVVGPADYDMNILFCCRKPV